MPRGRAYPEELRQEARRLRREGWSLNEIAARLGPPKNTLTFWVRDIVLTPQQRARLLEKERVEIGKNRALAALVNRQARIDRIDHQRNKATAFFDALDDRNQIDHIAAAMLYLAEGSKSQNSFSFGNSNPDVIRYWLYLLRGCFNVEEKRLRLQIKYRCDQDIQALQLYWTDVTGISKFHQSQPDPRTMGIPTKRLEYKGVCVVVYNDSALRCYLDALAHELMARVIA